MISRNVPAYASSDNAKSANDSSYATTWRGSVPGWIAYDLSNVEASHRGKVVVVWYNNDTYDYDYTIKNSGSYNSPKSYTIEANSAPGGGNAPTSGWVTLEKTTNNIYHSRQYAIVLTGYNCLRMNVSEVNSLSGNIATINLDIHYAAQGIEDDWIFYGDSITAGGMVDSTDYALLKRYLLGTLSDFPYVNGSVSADVNADGSINSTDYALVKKYLLGLIDKFPAENK